MSPFTAATPLFSMQNDVGNTGMKKESDICVGGVGDICFYLFLFTYSMQRIVLLN